MTLTSTQKSFVETYIGKPSGQTEFGPLNPAPPHQSRTAVLLGLWRDATHQMDTSVAALIDRLKSSKHPDMQNFAKANITTRVQGERTVVAKVLSEFCTQDGAGKEKAQLKLINQLDTYRSNLVANRLIDLCENNPIGVKFMVRAPMLSALDRIKQQVLN